MSNGNNGNPTEGRGNIGNPTEGRGNNCNNCKYIFPGLCRGRQHV